MRAQEIQEMVDPCEFCSVPDDMPELCEGCPNDKSRYVSAQLNEDFETAVLRLREEFREERSQW